MWKCNKPWILASHTTVMVNLVAHGQVGRGRVGWWWGLMVLLDMAPEAGVIKWWWGPAKQWGPITISPGSREGRTDQGPVGINDLERRTTGCRAWAQNSQLMAPVIDGGADPFLGSSRWHCHSRYDHFLECLVTQYLWKGSWRCKNVPRRLGARRERY